MSDSLPFRNTIEPVYPTNWTGKTLRYHQQTGKRSTKRRQLATDTCSDQDENLGKAYSTLHRHGSPPQRPPKRKPTALNYNQETIYRDAEDEGRIGKRPPIHKQNLHLLLSRAGGRSEKSDSGRYRAAPWRRRLKLVNARVPRKYGARTTARPAFTVRWEADGDDSWD